MSKITEKQLISKLSELKAIKPRQEWASLLKSQILAEKQEVVAEKNSATFAGFMNVFSQTFSQRKLAYSLATLALMVIGVLGFVKYETDVSFRQFAQSSQASLMGQTEMKQSVASLKVKINNLKVNDKTAVKEIAVSLKTLASVSGKDLTTNSEVVDLYETIVARQISDLKKSTLTIDQKKILTKAEDLYGQEKYSDALEQLLLIDSK